MVNVTNIGTPSIANKAFVPLAIEAGIETVITSLIPLAIDQRSLLIALVGALESANPALAAALNMDTLAAILRYMAQKPKTPIALAADLPVVVTDPGPVSVTAGRDGSAPTQINVTFSASPDGHTRYAIYLDAILQKIGILEAVGGYINDAIQNVPVDGLQHTIRVLYVTAEQAITLFGPIATFDNQQ